MFITHIKKGVLISNVMQKSSNRISIQEGVSIKQSQPAIPFNTNGQWFTH